jgi:hypothetical protein
MKTTEAEKLSIVGYLAANGMKPKKIKNGAAWYASPFAPEHGNSFKVDMQKNIWHDAATNAKGNILQLVMKLNKAGITGALLILLKPELSKTIKKP